MVRILSSLLLTLVLAAPAWADALGDLKAGTEAAEKGRYDDAITALTRALGAGTLSREDQVAALKARGNAYVAKGLMADAFSRRDEARQQIDKATADLTEALRVKPDDADLLADRGYAYFMTAQYDLAVDDFDTALRRRRSAVVLMQRATTYRALGRYDAALADYDAVLGMDLKDSGLERGDMVTERGYSAFLAGRFADAADDFDKALTVGAAAHAGDVLWAPYHVAWLHIARRRAGQDDKQALAERAGKLDLEQWPGTLIAYFLGQRSVADITSTGGHGMGRSRECNISFFVGQDSLIKGEQAAAERSLRRTLDVCNAHTINALAAAAELKRLKK